ncbi:hypothetical protein TB2_035907 [Malus domestica]
MSWKTLKHPSSRRIKKAFFVLRSSFFQDQAPAALGSTIIHQFKIKPRRPLKKVFFVHRSSKIKPRRPLKKAPSFIIRSSKIKPQRPLDQQRRQIHTSNRSARSSPKALRDPFITVLQRSSPKAPLKIRSNPPSRSSPRPLKNVHP